MEEQNSEGQVESGEAAGEAAGEVSEPQTAADVTKEALEGVRESLSESLAGDAGEAAGEAPEAGEAASEPSGGKAAFTITRDGEEVPLDESLSGLTVGYKARGEERQRSLDELVRLAQQGEGASPKIEQLRTQRNEAAQQLTELQQQAQTLQEDRKLFMRVLSDQSGESFKRLQEEYLKRRGGMPPAEGQGQQRSALPQQGDPNQPDPRLQAGQRFVTEHLVPHAEALAETYGADAKEIVRATLTELSGEPPQFLNQDVIEEVMNERVVAQLEAAGYEAKGDVPRWSAAQIAAQNGSVITPKEAKGKGGSELERENARLKERLEALEGKKAVRKAEKAPPGAGERSTTPQGSEGDLVNTKGIETKEDAKKQLRALQRGRKAG